MNKWKNHLSLLLFTVTCALTFNAQAAKSNKTAQISIENFVKLPGARDVKISPDGKHLSMVLQSKGAGNLAILDSKKLKPVAVFGVGSKKKGNAVGDVFWVNDERVIYTTTNSYAWNRQMLGGNNIYAANIDGKRRKIIFGPEAGEQSTGTNKKARKSDMGNMHIIDLLPDDKKHILVAFYPWSETKVSWFLNRSAMPIVYRVNVYSAKKKKMDNLHMPLATGFTDNAGIVRFSVGTDDNSHRQIAYKDKQRGDWTPLSIKGFEGKHIWPRGFTADNQSAYLEAYAGDGTRALYLHNFNNNTTKKLFHNEQVDVSHYIYDFDENEIVGVGTDQGLPDYQYFDKKHSTVKLHRSMMATFEGSDISFTSTTKDKKQVIVKAQSETNSGDYYLYDREKNGVNYLASDYEWLDPVAMATTKSMTIKTRDGTTIYGYLTKPKGSDKNLPMVVFPHGGPHGYRDYWAFDWEVQLLANRGYAVLQVNYRGSDGYGLAFKEAGHGQWGDLMQDDLTDATKAMIDSGVADGKRVCMYGVSYGAYAALMGAVKAPDLYRCVIGSAGVYSLPLMFKDGDIADRESGLAYLKTVLGDNPADLKSRSPAFNVNKIKAEVLLIHGSKDERAPMTHAELLMSQFDEIGKKYQWLEIGNEAHGYYDETNRLTVYNKILGFLDQHIGAGAL